MRERENTISLAPALSRSLALLFDADGTLVYPDGPVPGAPDAMRRLKQAGRRVAVVTNNSFLSQAAMHAKLARLGFPFELEEVVTAVVATARYVARELPGGLVHGQGSPGLRTELRAVGLRLTGAEQAELIVVGHDPRLTYHKLLRCARALRAGARFVAVNRDSIIAAPEGIYPGCGMAVAALEAASGRTPEVSIGKPSPLILEEAAGVLGHAPADCLFVGDNLASDIGAARAAGMPSLLVYTGITTPEDVAAALLRPDYILPSVVDLADLVAPRAVANPMRTRPTTASDSS